ncbi:uncharacterized protein K441DRAFT_40180 [Cenococcum geophilum 1.58]|uniref:uncharacterized protein n=1 Tax=Cenococcum geophilum 1.58 TaxID=794803 RepID=UPI00358F5A1A|nr:hypothetical protein K441DRAFT_40180 [Cenococcum geophilum 1.58]
MPNCYLMVGLPLHGIQPQGRHTSFLNRSITTSLLLQIQPLKEAYKPFYIRERINYRQYYSEIQDQEEPHHNLTRWTPNAIAKPLTSFSSALQSRVKSIARPASPSPCWRHSNLLRHPISLIPPTVRVIVANGCRYTQGPVGGPGKSPLAGRIKSKTYAVRSPFSPLTTPPLWPPKREYNAVSAERSMKFGNIVWVETLRHLIKITALWRKADRE